MHTLICMIRDFEMSKLKTNDLTVVDGKVHVRKQSCDYKNIRPYLFFTKYWIAIGGYFAKSNA